jgi:hypothetical protein
VKIRFDWSGREPAKPDFAMLRASLEAAQAATPTATASERAKPQVELTEALARLFGEAAVSPAALHGSFHPAPPAREDGEETG